MGTKAKPPIINWQGKDWRDIRGFEGIYEINELGQIRTYWKNGNRENKIIETPTKYLLQRGYCSKKGSKERATVCLYDGITKRKFKVARLVAREFLGMTNEQYNDRRFEVIHLNGDQMDCRVENLKITSPSKRALNYHKNKNESTRSITTRTR